MDCSCFFHRELIKNVIQITGPLDFCSLLILGGKKAILYDTMAGIGDLRRYLNKLTSLPITVVNSHGHFDHIGGNYQFESAWLSEKEYEATRWLRYDEMRADLVHRLEKNGGLQLDPIVKRNLLNGGFDRYQALEDGHIFNLGGITAEAVLLPGHTSGSTGLLLKEQRLLLSGDAMTPIMCLFFPESQGIEVYKDTLRKAIKLPIDAFATGHHTRLFPHVALNDFLGCANAVPTLRGLKFQHDLFPEYTGRLYLYRGENSLSADFLSLIGPAE